MSLTHTENGALSLASSGDAAVDFYFGMLDDVSDKRVRLLTLALYRANPTACLRLIFDLRNHSGGKGRRLVFRQALEVLFRIPSGLKDVLFNLKHVPKFGYYKDLLHLMCCPSLEVQKASLRDYSSTLREQCRVIFDFTPEEYSKKVKEGVRPRLSETLCVENVTLAFKYAPHPANSWERNHQLATKIRQELHLSEKAYRWMCCDARNLLNIVEKKMAARDWDNIDFSTISSIALSRYTKAMKKHCPERWFLYLQQVAAGKAKANTSKLYPYELINKLLKSEEPSLEVLFKEYALKHGTGLRNVLIVGDSSYSMDDKVTGSTTAYAIMCSLVLVSAMNNTGNLRNKFIQFSGRSELMTLPEGSIRGQLSYINAHRVVENTNVGAAFDQALSMIQSGEKVETIMVISDMQFDPPDCATQTNFEAIQDKFRKAGAKVPRLVFWNVTGRACDVPTPAISENVVLISGFTPALYERIATSEEGFKPLSFVESIVNDPMYSKIMPAP